MYNRVRDNERAIQKRGDFMTFREEFDKAKGEGRANFDFPETLFIKFIEMHEEFDTVKADLALAKIDVESLKQDNLILKSRLDIAEAK